MIYNRCILNQGEDMEMKIIKRDGSIVDYNPEKIRIAIKKANKEVSRKEKATDAEIDEIGFCWTTVRDYSRPNIEDDDTIWSPQEAMLNTA